MGTGDEMGDIASYFALEDTHVPPFKPNLQTVITQLCLLLFYQATFSKIPIGFIPLGQTSSLSHTLFAESGNKVQ